MKIFTIICFTFFGTLLLSGCQKNIDLFIPDSFQPGVDTTWQAGISSNSPVISLKADLKNNVIVDSFSYSAAGVFFSSGNISIAIPPNGLVKNNGTAVAGTIKRESLLIQKKGDFIAMNMPTTSNNLLLVSGGSFYLQLKNNDDNVSIANEKKISVKYSAAIPVADNKIYNGGLNANGNFTWLLNNDTINKSIVTNTGYEIQTNKLQYVLSAHLIDTVGAPQTALALKLPAIYTNANTVAYIVFNNVDCVAELIPNSADRKFNSPPLPINKDITIVVISKINGDYYFGFQQTTTGTSTQQINITPIKKSLDFIKSYLNTL